VEIVPIVVLSHPKARGHYESPTVNVALNVDHILGFVAASETTLGPREREEIERLIVRDHEFHEQRRSTRR
jgi:hypothetical protein